ncbi:uncharacterized protein C8Q71DRAFT_728162 [Rhodofomes roseus]|uniref:Uncharacterized protein n=1 Tax=Rhodofomes roseus TaxID=34475 RepID=A0ABQ8JYN4_9APHY|nr:uncharacterized protein C8Q71DRAFT_728162 [Rhodofomes roseus]KAH9829290.1 hypothetical protein C8Q71DRAFT_728162 [Rhodofomes roseus]
MQPYLSDPISIALDCAALGVGDGMGIPLGHNDLGSATICKVLGLVSHDKKDSAVSFMQGNSGPCVAHVNKPYGSCILYQQHETQSSWKGFYRTGTTVTIHSFDLKTDVNVTATGWQGKHAPELSLQDITARWLDGSIKEVVANFLPLPYEGNGGFPASFLNPEAFAHIPDMLIGEALHDTAEQKQSAKGPRGKHMACIIGHWRQSSPKITKTRWHRNNEQKVQAVLCDPLFKLLNQFIRAVQSSRKENENESESESEDNAGKKPRDGDTAENKDGASWGTNKNPNARCWKLIEQLEKKEHRKVLIGRKKGEKSSGDTKVAVSNAIARVLWPNLAEQEVPEWGKKVLNKINALKALYAKKVKAIKVTGGGLSDNESGDGHGDSDDENGPEQRLRCYITAEGPDGSTPETYKNIWERIEKEFPPFPRLHRLLASKASINPPSVTTGIGPHGRKTAYYQPKDDDAEREEPGSLPHTEVADGNNQPFAPEGPDAEQPHLPDQEPAVPSESGSAPPSPSASRAPTASSSASQPAPVPSHISPEKYRDITSNFKAAPKPSSGIGDVLREVTQLHTEDAKLDRAQRAADAAAQRDWDEIKDLREEIRSLRAAASAKHDRLLRQFTNGMLSQELYLREVDRVDKQMDAEIADLQEEIKEIKEKAKA